MQTCRGHKLTADAARLAEEAAEATDAALGTARAALVNAPPPPGVGAERCSACGGVTDNGADHPMVCTGAAGKLRVARHNALRDVICEEACTAGVTASTEPLVDAYFPHKPDVDAASTMGRRGDVPIRDDHRNTRRIVDVVVTRIQTHDEAGRNPAYSVDEAERRKTTDYNRHWDVPADGFTPFGLDTAGGTGDGAARLIKYISAAHAAGGTAYDYAAQVRRVRQHLSTTLWKRNAAIIDLWQAAFPSVTTTAAETAAARHAAQQDAVAEAAAWARLKAVEDAEADRMAQRAAAEAAAAASAVAAALTAAAAAAVAKAAAAAAAAAPAAAAAAAAAAPAAAATAAAQGAASGSEGAGAAEAGEAVGELVIGGVAAADRGAAAASSSWEDC